MEPKHIVIKLRELREKHELSQTELAERLGLSRQSVISLEQGKFFPSLPIIVQLCQVFDRAFEDLIEYDGPEDGIENIENNQPSIKIIKSKEATMPGFLEPWRPYRESLSLREAMDRLMEDSIVSPRSALGMAPKINVLEKGANIVIKAEVPEVKEEDLDIEVADDLVTISGERKDEKETKDEDYFHKETHYGSFSRTVTLPSAVVAEKAEAKVRNGVLTVTIPKVEEKKAKKVKIATS